MGLLPRVRWFHYLALVSLLANLVSCLELVDFHAAQCLSDSECGYYKSCVGGQCQTKVCKGSSDCYGFDVCTNGLCQPKPCVTVSDCITTYGTGRCVADANAGGSFCHSSDYCTSNAMCAAPLVCVNSSCRGAPCSTDDECFPYLCGLGQCTTTCETSYLDCHPEGMCVKQQCINPDCTAATESKCLGFSCDLASSQCDNTCGASTSLVGTEFVTTPYGCAAGYVCHDDCELPCANIQDPLCGGYLCDVAAAACQHYCASTADCAAGYFCHSSACEKGSCSTDASCGGYLCVNGQCSTLCATQADCASGYECVGSACNQP